MARVAVAVGIAPGVVEVSCRMRRSDDAIMRLTAVIDTGAQISLFPVKLLDEVEHEILQPRIELEQAGIARQRFIAVEARVFLMLEDQAGNMTEWLAVPAWFTKTKVALIGFDGLLDRAELYLNLRTGREAWIEV